MERNRLGAVDKDEALNALRDECAKPRRGFPDTAEFQ
jgi:hypothetical protein